MSSLQPAMFQLLVLCGVVALILERAMSVLCNPKHAQRLARVRESLPATLRAWIGKVPDLPVRDALTLGGAVAISDALALHLIAAVKAGVVPAEIDTLVTGLFIAGLAQLVQQLLARIAPELAATAATQPRRLGFEPAPGATEPVAATSVFRLGRLAKPASADVADAPRH